MIRFSEFFSAADLYFQLSVVFFAEIPQQLYFIFFGIAVSYDDTVKGGFFVNFFQIIQRTQNIESVNIEVSQCPAVINDSDDFDVLSVAPEAAVLLCCVNTAQKTAAVNQYFFQAGNFALITDEQTSVSPTFVVVDQKTFQQDTCQNHHEKHCVEAGVVFQGIVR